MKNKKSLIVGLMVLGLSSLGLLSGYSSTAWLQANILGDTGSQLAQIELDYSEVIREGDQTAEAFEDKLLVDVSFMAPKSPDFLNGFNIYRNIKSEKALLAGYSDQIKGDNKVLIEEYQDEILSFVYRTANSPYVSNKLPMWPEYNTATVGNVLAYLFPDEPNPLLFAKGLGLVTLDARSQSYMSRSELIEVIGKLFIKEGRDPYTLLKTSGFIDDENKWRETSKEGFLLVDAIRIVLNVREILERSNIQASKVRYENQLIELDKDALVLDDASLEVLMIAFVNELRDEKGAPKVPARVNKKFEEVFSPRFGMPLTTELVTEVREVFFRTMKRDIPEVYELPPLVTTGDCDLEMFRKTYMGAVAVTGPAGASIICEKVMIQFPANSYLLNIHSLPKITTSLDRKNPGRMVVRTDALRSYKNSLILSPLGEGKVRIVLRPEGVENMIGEAYQVSIKEQDSDDVVNQRGVYEEEGAVVRAHLRNFSGDNLIIFDK